MIRSIGIELLCKHEAVLVGGRCQTLVLARIVVQNIDDGTCIAYCALHNAVFGCCTKVGHFSVQWSMMS